MNDHDKDIGMQRQISRRDLLHSAGLLSLAAATPGVTSAAPISTKGATKNPYYPPALTGLRGAHVGSYEAAHELAGQLPKQSQVTNTADEQDYDLVVVGAGISGLSAAYFYRQQNPDARILILDNHDDFGGHAKRNEFLVNNKRLIGYGGSQSIDTPSEYSDVSLRLLRELNIKLNDFEDFYDQDFYQKHGLASGVYFDKANYGVDKFVPADFLLNSPMLNLATTKQDPANLIQQMPISNAAKEQIAKLCLQGSDDIPDTGITEVADHLNGFSYEHFLKKIVGVTEPQIFNLLQNATAGYYGVGIDGVSAMEAILFGLPGKNRLGIPAVDSLYSTAVNLMTDPYIYHFPDGNAGIARLLVRSLIPTLSKITDPAAFNEVLLDYSRLDQTEQSINIRLNSTALHVANLNKEEVAVTYRKDGANHQLKAKRCVLACYNMMIPYLCPSLPDVQKAALKEQVKVPLVYTNVVLNNWHALKQQGVGMALTPNNFHDYVMVDFPISLGNYQYSQNPDEPIILHFSGVPTAPGLPSKQQYKVGRAKLLATSFESIERDLRGCLNGLLGSKGFDAAKDIAAITVNRWPHGYTNEPGALDPQPGPEEAPSHEIGRQKFGNISIANSDAGARAYVDCAIDQAHRAVEELVS